MSEKAPEILAVRKSERSVILVLDRVPTDEDVWNIRETLSISLDDLTKLRRLAELARIARDHALSRPDGFWKEMDSLLASLPSGKGGAG